MEYKIFETLRTSFNVHIYIRFVIGVILGILSLIPIILPIFPGSLFLWVFMLVVWILLIVPAQKVRHVIKLRKWIVYMFKNLHRRHMIKHKMNDISLHIRQILNEEKPSKKSFFQRKMENKRFKL